MLDRVTKRFGYGAIKCDLEGINALLSGPESSQERHTSKRGLLWMNTFFTGHCERPTAKRGSLWKSTFLLKRIFSRSLRGGFATKQPLSTHALNLYPSMSSTHVFLRDGYRAIS